MPKTKKNEFNKDVFLKNTFDHIAKYGYNSFDPNFILDEMNVNAKDLPYPLKTKEDVLILFEEHITDQLLEVSNDLFDGSENAKEKLFELLMERFDLMEPYKDGLHEIFKSLPANPILILKSLPSFKDMAFTMLDLADADMSFPLSEMKIIGFTYVYLRSVKNWFEDDTVDQGKTMAAIDKHLTFAESITKTLFRFG